MNTREHRVFLGWQDPLIRTAARRLLKDFVRSPGDSLGHVTIVTPGARAGRSLLRVLLESLPEGREAVIPPRLITPGALPELFYRPELPVATELETRLIWVGVLQQHPELLSGIFPQAADGLGLMPLIALAEKLSQLRAELAATGLPPDEVIANLESEYQLIGERWAAIAELMRLFEEAQDELGLDDPHHARRKALASGVLESPQTLILLGTLDLPPIARSFLDASGSSFEAWIQAPQEEAPGFDKYGCVNAGYWKERPIQIADVHIQYARTPRDQGLACVRAIASWQKTISADDLVIAVPDPELAPFIAEELESRKLTVRDVGGTPLSITGPITLLGLMARFLSGGEFDALAALLRHPDFERWIKQREEFLKSGDLISLADRYQTQTLPSSVFPITPGDCRERPVVAEICGVLARVAAYERGERSLGEWGRRVLSFLEEIYGKLWAEGKPLPKTTSDALEAVGAVVVEIMALPPALAIETSYPDAIAMILRRVSQERSEPESLRGAVELSGWLELYLDDRPNVIVTGCNEGFIPESVNEDPFLPNAIRSALNLTDNDRRYARDAAALLAILHGRRGVSLVAGALGPGGELRLPSRLLLSDPEQTAARIAKFNETFSRELSAPPVSAAADKKSGYLPPFEPKDKAGIIRKVSVTGLAAYMSCPYRFFLEQVERLQELRDEQQELDPRGFGSLGHDVLKRFSDEPSLARLDDPKLLAEALNELLDHESAKRFGPKLLPAVELQAAQLRHRLALFAEWQAARARDGWIIKLTEYDLEAPLETPEGDMIITARIDRMDYHPELRKAAIFDYKFADKTETAAAFHRGRDWKSLQLPLYRWLAENNSVAAAPDVGLLPLAGDMRAFQAQMLEWEADKFDAALEKAREVGAQILRGVFWPPSPRTRPTDPFRWICASGLDEELDTE